MNKMIVLDVGVLDRTELTNLLAAVDAHIDDGEHARAWTILEPMMKKVNQMHAFASSVPIWNITPELMQLIMLKDQMQSIFDKLEHIMTSQYEKERLERLWKIGL
jgi:hypothetical protein